MKNHRHKLTERSKKDSSRTKESPSHPRGETSKTPQAPSGRVRRTPDGTVEENSEEAAP